MREFDVKVEDIEAIADGIFALKIFDGLRSLQESGPGGSFVAEHVMGHAEVELDFRFLAEQCDAFVDGSEGTGIIAFVVEDPAESICGKGIVGLQSAGLFGEGEGLIHFTEVFGEEIGEVVESGDMIGANLEKTCVGSLSVVILL